MKDEKPVKDRKCIKCEQFFDCVGKDPHVKDCLNFKERKEEEKWRRRWL